MIVSSSLKVVKGSQYVANCFANVLYATKLKSYNGAQFRPRLRSVGSQSAWSNGCMLKPGF